VSLARCPRCGLEAPTGSLAFCPRCLLSPAPDGADTTPTAPPGLALENELGRGGMGRVFRARHLRLERPVAVKFLPPELAADPVFEDHFRREARLLAKLSHPHIVAVYDSGVTEDGGSYLVMELMAGGTLAERLPLPAPQALRITLELCEGLGYAHDKGMVHRDVKPANVLFDERGRAKLADFGIARVVDPADASHHVTRPSLVIGTPEYMAPEARRGAPPDPRMDLFALGVMLEEMIAGAGLIEALPAPIATVVLRATAADPRNRPANAAELAAMLRAAQAALPAVPDRGELAPSPLPPDEVSWQRAVALVLAGATAISLYAFLVSVTPRTHDAGDHLPYTVFGAVLLPDGRVFTRARFEIWPTLAAAGAFAFAVASYGLLRRHWRHAGLDDPRPDVRIPATAGVVKMAALLNAIMVARIALEWMGARAAVTYVPVLGGVLELVMVHKVWMVVLEARRTSRPLGRERLLWIGLALSLLPPLVSFVRMMSGRAP
jgi:eukaryotic-like serine/threonine-protein kinase